MWVIQHFCFGIPRYFSNGSEAVLAITFYGWINWGTGRGFLVMYSQWWGLQIFPVQFPCFWRTLSPTSGRRELLPCYHPCPAPSAGAGADISAMPGHLHAYICMPIAEFCVFTVTHRQTHTLYKSRATFKVDGAVGLHLWLFSTGENSSRSFIWQRVAFLKELLVLSDFSVTMTFGRLKFLLPYFLCYLYDYDKEDPNIPVWSYVIYIHSIFYFWYTPVCGVATFNISASDEYLFLLYLSSHFLR